jgi:glutamine amidotransferase
MIVALVDYGMGNMKSIRNALRVVTKDVRIVTEGCELELPDAVVVPGVGSFADGMENLRQRGFIEPLTELVLKEEIPYLGICLGLQFLAERSTEGGVQEGMGWISGKVTRIEPDTEKFRVPHMGWNNVSLSPEIDSILFDGFDTDGTFYFVHSYHLDPETIDQSRITSTSWHGTDVTASIRKNNIFGVQFHPEKSQATGLKLLENFTSYVNGGDDL